MKLRTPSKIFFAATISTACSLDPLPESWELDRPRILGVRATPAEPQPGELTTFESLVYLPDGLIMDANIWFACLPEAGSAFGCESDPDALAALQDPEASGLTEEEAFERLVEAGMIGAEPFWPPSWTPPADALDALTPEERLEGLSATVNVTLLPGCAEDGTAEIDPELAFKRIPVSMATNPNHNPDFLSIEIDGESYRSGQRFTTTVGSEHEINPILTSDSIEDYEFVNASGMTEERTEEPYFTWYVEGGRIDTPSTLYPYSSIAWEAPMEAFEGLVVIVARDRRGGMAWAHLNVEVLP